MSSKFLYNLKGIGRMLAPNFLLNLEREIAKIWEFDSASLESIQERVRYYCKLSAPFNLQDFALSPPPSLDSSFKENPPFKIESPKISLLKDAYKGRYFSAYYYDGYEFSRYFARGLLIGCAFGDVNYYLQQPAITKSRPIADFGDISQNSVLFKLDKDRHFAFVKDSVPFESKRDILFFRGAAYQQHRIKFLEKFFHAPFCDVAHTGKKEALPQFYKPKVSKEAHLPYKFLLSLEGNDVASNLKWILNSNSLCLSPKMKLETWFMEGKLEAGVHYACISDEYEDVEETMEYYKANPARAKEIIQNAHEFCAQFFNPKIERALALLVLRKYFYLSGQIEISAQEKAFFGC
ncbi:lipopolysaccharide core biosynthesis protein LpsA [Helicobacter sp. MIT 00-7814]|uniref:glycosyl transferase family 90 n=1 Tax=unclassified Helicobacter TaxID=2593540 RepID=UPI000E1FB4BF|nr:MULTISPECIES: glycosyl transferase family 90 [unclassified Helicobacter]RDU52451.1 lipopolysaccharide core biosynthesis protein LpsA [Helicobacter sp. MIT 00-7814]RDU53161.1 lipopolysaccharide core biosynthesis protein LpsA [Helicobacter sp. MIT 99-10781]